MTLFEFNRLEGSEFDQDRLRASVRQFHLVVVVAYFQMTFLLLEKDRKIMVVWRFGEGFLECVLSVQSGFGENTVKLWQT